MLSRRRNFPQAAEKSIDSKRQMPAEAHIGHRYSSVWRRRDPGVIGLWGEEKRRGEGWCPRPESNRYGREAEGFSYHFGFRRQRGRCSWSGARLHLSLAALGARRLLSTPSPAIRPGLGSALARNGSRAFAEFDGLHLWSFLQRAQISSSPLCLPISPLGHCAAREGPAAGETIPSRGRRRRPAGLALRR